MWTSAQGRRRGALARATGDQIVIAAEPLELRDERLVSRALDNRLGVFVAIEVARRVTEAGGGAGPVRRPWPRSRRRSAPTAPRVMAYGLEPDLAVVVDVTHATDAPGVESRRARRPRPRVAARDHPRRHREPRDASTCSTRWPRRRGSSARPRLPGRGTGTDGRRRPPEPHRSADGGGVGPAALHALAGGAGRPRRRRGDHQAPRRAARCGSRPTRVSRAGSLGRTRARARARPRPPARPPPRA